jgi:PPK2 family polyphosphate:nucleotide phosphotransferase
MKKIDPDDFRVRPGKKVDLDKWPTKAKPGYRSQEEYQQLLAEHVHKLSAQQSRLYADDTYAMLLIFQAMDAAGKDSAIKHVMSGVNPQGCQVYSFKHPSVEDLDHDFLWNAMRKLPERGRIGIFNRSYYEEVLIVRVHKAILDAERLPSELLGEKTLWRDRYRSIVNLEDHLHRNGTRIVKFFLHLSKEEQRKRFLSRIDEPDKNWKFSVDDVKERESWNHYRKAYEECFSATSTATAPWYVVPADDKATTQLIVSRIVLDAFKDLKLEYPQLSAERLQELQKIRKLLAKK